MTSTGHLTSEQEKSSLVFRELNEATEIVDFLKLRHRVYFEECGYGDPKPFGLDLSAYDARSRMFGVFAGSKMVGGVRLVFREPQAHAAALRAIHAVAGGLVQEQRSRTFPCEESFDLTQVVGLHRELIDLEISRLVVPKPGLGPGMIREFMNALIGMAHHAGCRFYAYTCSREMSKRYARMSAPRWTIDSGYSDGISSDAFRFPTESTVAAVADVAEMPELARAIAYGREIRAHGFARLRTGPELVAQS